MSLDNIETLAGKFESFEALQDYCDQQYQTLLRLKHENSDLKAEIAHLKELVVSTSPLLPSPAQQTIKFNVSTEESICEAQIQKLQEKAYNRDLTLEETKRLEILVKSLYLIREKHTADLEADYKTLRPGETLESLAVLASAPDPSSEAE